MKVTKKTKKKKKNTYIKNSIVRVVVGGSLVVFGFGCFFYPNFREWRTQNDVNQIIEEFDKNYEQGISNEITSDDDIDIVIDTDSADSADSDNDEIEKDSDKTDGQYTRPYQALYDMLTDYNENLAANGQKIESAWSDGQHPIDLSAYVRCQNAIAVKRELKADLRAKSECADKALDIFNGHMDEVLVKMNMPADALGIGFQYNNRFLEFVSYRKDNVSPYILEDINMPHMNSHRFKAMSFDEFQTCLTKYAKKEKNSYLMDIALNMKPVKEDSEDTNLEADFEGQLRLFAC